MRCLLFWRSHLPEYRREHSSLPRIFDFVAAQPLGPFASAEPKRSDDVPRAVVSFVELDLAKPAGADTVYRRIRVAAESVCKLHQSRDSATEANTSGEGGRVARLEQQS